MANGVIGMQQYSLFAASLRRVELRFSACSSGRWSQPFEQAWSLVGRNISEIGDDPYGPFP